MRRYTARCSIRSARTADGTRTDTRRTNRFGGFPSRAFLILCVLAFTVVGGATEMGNSSRGEQVLKEQGCLDCHGANRSEGDLGRRSPFRSQSPCETAASIWNHAPDIFSALERESIVRPQLTRSQAEDLFAYFRAARYFAVRGEAVRGKEVFEAKGCDGCHSLSKTTETAGAAPVEEWTSPADVSEWATALWNHIEVMTASFEKGGLEWPQFTEQEMEDLALFAWGKSAASSRERTVRFGDPDTGRHVFETRGCESCHSVGEPEAGKIHLQSENRDGHTLANLSASIWNHGPAMHRRAEDMGMHIPRLTGDEMRALTSYLYAARFFHETGNPERGQRVFESKGCGSCHRPGEGFPDDETDRPFTPAWMVWVTWHHGPSMQTKILAAGTRWPTFSEREMEDLLAYFNHLE